MSGRTSKKQSKSNPPLDLDLSAWIQKTFKERKLKNPSYSIRAYARDLDISHTALNQLFKGTFTPALATAKKILGRLGLEPAQIATTLRQARISQEKDPEIRKLLQKKKPPVQSLVRLDPTDFGSNGLFPAILTLAYLSLWGPGKVFTSKDVSEATHIDLANAQEILGVLVKKDMLRQDEDRKFNSLGKRWEFLSTDHSLPLKKVHLQALKLAEKRIMETRPTERYSVTETLAIPHSKLSELQAKCDEFIDELRELTAASADTSDRIYLLSLHAVPWFSK